MKIFVDEEMKTEPSPKYHWYIQMMSTGLSLLTKLITNLPPVETKEHRQQFDMLTPPLLDQAIVW
jgi:hypothetical protein